MKVAITADSTCDLPRYIIKDRGITITPLSILLGDKSYLDGVEIGTDEIYDYVEKTGNLPKTAAIPPAQYIKVFSELTEQGYSVVHIGLSSAISSSYQNSTIAAAEFDNVYCVDSKNLCTGMGLLVLKACDLRDNGFDAQQIANRITALVPKVQSTFVINSLEYLHKGGRCSGVAKFGANVLGLKPSIAIDTDTGALDVAKKYRGKIEVVYRQYTNDCLSDLSGIDKSRLAISNSGGVSNDTIEYAKELAGDGFGEIITAKAGCTISSHCGPKTFAIFYLND